MESELDTRLTFMADTPALCKDNDFSYALTKEQEEAIKVPWSQDAPDLPLVYEGACHVEKSGWLLSLDLS